MTIRGKRTRMVGVHLRPRVKQVLKEEAEAHKVRSGLPVASMSAVGSELIEEGLKKRGYDLKEQTGPVETPLLDAIEETKPCAE